MKYKVGDAVYHNGHGKGVIVELNGTPKKEFKAEHVLMAGPVIKELGAGIVNSFYDKESFPYVVQFAPTEKYPKGYKDVYGDLSLFSSEEDYKSYMKATYNHEG